MRVRTPYRRSARSIRGRHRPARYRISRPAGGTQFLRPRPRRLIRKPGGAGERVAQRAASAMRSQLPRSWALTTAPWLRSAGLSGSGTMLGSLPQWSSSPIVVGDRQKKAKVVKGHEHCRERVVRRTQLFKMGIAGKGKKKSPGRNGTYVRTETSSLAC